MNDKNMNVDENNSFEPTIFDYDTSDLPRDFDIRIEVAEQREVLDLS
ncbi:MAG: hypothetical protein P8I03_09815 [Thalassotalea sp.]|nr:hypothetical protein [Thalassotalea sp.]